MAEPKIVTGTVAAELQAMTQPHQWESADVTHVTFAVPGQRTLVATLPEQRPWTALYQAEPDLARTQPMVDLTVTVWAGDEVVESVTVPWATADPYPVNLA